MIKINSSDQELKNYKVYIKVTSIDLFWSSKNEKSIAIVDLFLIDQWTNHKLIYLLHSNLFSFYFKKIFIFNSIDFLKNQKQSFLFH